MNTSFSNFRKYCSISLIMFLIAAFISSCESRKEKSMKHIVTLEKSVFADTTKRVDPNTARELVTACIDFSKEFPESQEAPEMLFKAAQTANGVLQLPVEALEYYRMITEKFADSKQAPVSLFLQGFIYENNTHNFVQAKAIYERFLKEYPNHKMAQDVRFSLEHLGMSDEELIKMFEAKNN